jgi:hypothetical protein
MVTNPLTLELLSGCRMQRADFPSTFFLSLQGHLEDTCRNIKMQKINSLDVIDYTRIATSAEEKQSAKADYFSITESSV